MKKILLMITLIIIFSSMSNGQPDYYCEGVDTLPGPQPLPLAGCDLFQFSLDELNSMPIAEIKLAIHFQENGNGDNFTCDENDPIRNRPGVQDLIYAPLFAEKLIFHMNDKLDEGLWVNGQQFDTRIRVKLVDETDECSSLFFYNSPNSYQPLSSALNIKILNTTTTSIGGWVSPWDYNTIHMNGVLHRVLNNTPTSTLKPWSLATNIIHEFGHTRDLDHTFNCNNPCDDQGFDVDTECGSTPCIGNNGPNSCWGKSPNLLTMASGDYNRFTECEFNHLWGYMLNHPVPNQSFCDDNSSPTEIVYDINGLDVWTGKKIFNSNVIIKSGTTIEIQCEVLMGAGKKIVVESGAKLIVNGGKITDYCGALWEGITVNGGNPDFDVKTYNNAKIENTEHAAVSMFPDLPWPQGGNGILHADNTTFNNCKRMVEFISFDPSPNSSHINECTQNGGKWGITNWNCQGIVVTDNVFNDISDHGILTEAGSFYIDGNEFHSGINDILYLNTSAGYPSIIQNNNFYGLQTGYRGLGTTLGRNELINNTFHSGLWNVFMDGDNHYLIELNEFNASSNGVVGIANGNHYNDVIENEFNGNDVGISALYNNSEFQFLENCFTSTIGDVYIDGNIANNIATNGNQGAGNCFTHDGNSGSNVIDIDGNPDPFNYYEPDPVGSPTCINAILAHPNVAIVKAGYEGNGCLPGSPGGNVSNNDKSSEPVSIGMTRETQIISSDFITTKHYLVTQEVRERSMDQWINDRKRKKEGDLIVATTDDDVVDIFSTYILDNDLSGARNYIEGITATSEQLIDFVTIQLLNLERLENGPFYQFDAQKLSTIYAIAIKQHPYAAYAKSLYYVLTEILISSELPSFLEWGVQIRSKGNTSTINDALVYPNPFKDKLLIDIGNYKDVKISIVDFSGQTIFQSINLNENLEILTHDWDSGLYVVTLRQDNRIIHINKYLLIK